MKATFTSRLDDGLAGMLRAESQRSGQTQSEIAREALRHHFAEAAGYATNEDAFRNGS